MTVSYHITYMKSYARGRRRIMVAGVDVKREPSWLGRLLGRETTVRQLAAVSDHGVSWYWRGSYEKVPHSLRSALYEKTRELEIQRLDEDVA